ncbi:Zinc finger BED domain-containing protein RICESLEEPER 2 [Linum grandiflorum]
MLESALPYQDIFSRLSMRESSYSSLPSSDDWMFASMVCKKLEIFKMISELFSGNKYPTANLFFPRICELKLKLIEWKLHSDEIIVAMAERMSAKFNKFWTDIHLLLIVAVVLDPAYKLELIDYYWVKFGCSDSSLEPDNVKVAVYNMVREYQLKKQIHDQISLDIAGSSNGAGIDSRISDADLDYELYLSRRKRVKTNSVCSELDHYLSEDVSPQAPNVSVLDW